MNSNYFDYAAATPVSKTVLAAMQPYFTEKFYNPSARYLSAIEVRKDIDVAREIVAKCLGVRPREIIFTAGGTEANNLAIKGLMSKYPDGHCIVGAVEHDSIIEPAKEFSCSIVEVQKDGKVDVKKLEKELKPETVLVSIQYVNNEIGTIQPLKDVRAALDKELIRRNKAGEARPLYLHTDACQATNYLNVMPHSLGVDLMTLNGGKIYGPKQSGMLYVKAGIDLNPLIYGGGQERGLRSGTENVAAIVGFSVAIKEATEIRAKSAKTMQELQNYAFELIEKKLHTTEINGPRTNRIANNLHLTIQGVDNERLMMELDEIGYQVATGSACNASSGTPSHVLKAIGMSDEEAQSSIRLTFGRYTTKESVKSLVDQIKESLLEYEISSKDKGK